MRIGAQLYTVRDFCKTPEAFVDTLGRVADIGYKYVQVSGTCDYTPEWLRDRLAENGLSCTLTHIPYKRIVGEPEKVVSEHKLFGCRYIGLGSMPDFKKNGCRYEDYEKFRAQITPAVKTISSLGAKFMYHNHNMELASHDGVTYLERMASDYTPDEFGITLDTYWVQAGGGDPAWWLRRLDGRINCIHLKDMCYNGADNAVRMAPVGCGNMNFDAILKAAADCSCEYAFVEQDNCYDEDPFSCLAKSYAFLKSRGLE